MDVRPAGFPAIGPPVINHALAIGAVVASVAVGRSVQIGWRRWAVIGLNVVAAAGLVALLGQARDHAIYYESAVGADLDAAHLETFVVEHDGAVTINGEPVIGLTAPDAVFVEAFTRDEVLVQFAALTEAYGGQLVSVKTPGGSYTFGSVQQLDAILGGAHGTSSTTRVDPTAPFQG